MRIELCAFADEAADGLSEQIDALKRNNIKKIELRSVDGVNVRDISEDSARAMAEQISAAGLSVWSLGSPLGKSDISANLAEEEKLLNRLIKLCKIFGCDKIRMFSFFTDKPQQVEKEVISRLKVLAEKAAESGVLLCHENEKDIFGDTVGRIETLLENVPHLAYVYDPANYVQVGETEENMRRIAEKAEYYHIKDALKTGELVPAGEGDGNIDALIKSLRRDTTFTLEPHLAVFSGYAAVDAHEMKNKYTFNSNGESFDFAVSALKKLLKANGFTESDGAFVK